MKFVFGLILLSLCFCSLAVAVDVPSFGAMLSLQKRDALYTSECQAGVLAMYLNSEYVSQEQRRECFDPEPVAKTEHEYIVRCTAESAWVSACTSAGGEVCHVSASVFGKYGGDSDEEATYKYEAAMCVPVSCKKGGNLEEYENSFVSSCRNYDLTNCKMKIACGKAAKKAVVIVGAVLGTLLIVALLGIGGFFIYRRYAASRALTPRSVEDGSELFAEYSELAQYEKEDDAFITGDLPEDEEEHTIN